MRLKILIILLFFLPADSAHGIIEESLHFGRFGNITLYRTAPHPSHVVLFVSGDGGWNLGVVDMARELSSLDSLVVGIDITGYLKALGASSEKCSYPAADFEALSKFVQKKLDFTQYELPVLVGYSSGATLVYAILVQAPPGTFQGAISLGFCPDLMLTRPLCRGNGLEYTAGPHGKGYSFLPAANLRDTWIAFQGLIDQVCNPGVVEQYVKQVGRGEEILLPKVGHGFSVPRNWMPQFRQAFARLAEKDKPVQLPKDELRDLPLIEVPASGQMKDAMVVMISGDGGWAGIDRELAKILAEQGLPVVGLNSLQYFWKPRTPEYSGNDLERILRFYLSQWHKQKVILVGYSLGADVLPFMVNRLSRDVLNRVQMVVLLGPGQAVSFEFHLSDWLGGSSGKGALPVLPEVEKLKGMKIVCFHGEEEKDTLCRQADSDSVEVITLKGAHHFGGDYGKIAEIILKKAEGTGQEIKSGAVWEKKIE